MLRRMTFYNISESFNAVRWAIAIISFAFVAVVSLAKYINLSGMTSITFSSIETTYLILNDATSIAYIYLPVYLFVICGLMFDDNFGSLEVIKCGTRKRWIVSKYLTLLFYTVMFFVCLVGISFLISNQVFPASSHWSQDFVKVQVFMGQNPINFTYTPVVTVGLSVLSVFFMYLCAGTLSLLVSLITNREADALMISLGAGISLSAIFVYGLQMTSQMSAQAFGFRNAILIGLIVMMCIGTVAITNRRDFNVNKRQ